MDRSAAAAPFTVEPLRRRRAETCEYIGPEGCFWSKGRRILYSRTVDGDLREVATIPSMGWRGALGGVRLGRRLARQTVYNVVPVNSADYLFFSFATSIGLVREGLVEVLPGRARETRLLRQGIAKLPDGSLVFGEYFDNPNREAVHLYRLPVGGDRVDVVHRFEPGEIRHVHSVNWDPFEGRIVVATGDVDDECALWSFSPDLSNRAVLGRAGEDWRAISPQFTATTIYFGTDAQYQQNYLCGYDRESGETRRLAPVNGPVFYSARFRDGFLFATSAELCPSQTSPEASIYHVNPLDGEVTLVVSYPKDRLPTRYFQFGLISFPTLGSDVDKLPVSGTALRGLDGRFVSIV